MIYMEEVDFLTYYKIEPVTFYGDERYIIEINAEYKVFEEDEETQEDEKIIAKSKFKYIDVDFALKEEYNCFDLFDSYSTTLEHYYALYDGKNLDKLKFSCKVMELFKSKTISSLNILIVERLEILPEYRGKNISNKIIDEISRLFGKSSFIALKSYPLQMECKREDDKVNSWEKDMQLDRCEQDEKKARKKLQDYYVKLGFKYVNDDIMLKSL